MGTRRDLEGARGRVGEGEKRLMYLRIEVSTNQGITLIPKPAA